jgi:predicted DNA-binding protein
MPTNKGDTVINVSKDVRDLLKKLAKLEGRTMKGMLAHIINKYVKEK